MKNVSIKKWTVAMMFLGFSTMALADWEYAIVRDEKPAGGSYTKCIYESIYGFRFSMIKKLNCPASVEVNPETGEVRER
ncbi:hypothetical protein [Rodentibacter caecimuris]|uniref:hypothetical protein n=1 Tax=Rodentibacter caecimuris TaxID=1796644 RepID=UPI00258BC410|nr:hypothetical protein [Rodentibacter heylii]